MDLGSGRNCTRSTKYKIVKNGTLKDMSSLSLKGDLTEDQELPGINHNVSTYINQTRIFNVIWEVFQYLLEMMSSFSRNRSMGMSPRKSISHFNLSLITP